MRILEIVDFAALLSFFALLLVAFGFDFHVSRNVVTKHRNKARFFLAVSVVGATTAAIGLMLTWLALFLDQPTVSIDAIIVFIPGSIAVLCIVVLTAENAWTRLRSLQEEELDH